MRLGLGVGGADAGVEEDQPVVVPYQIGEYRFDPWPRAAGLDGGADEVAEVEAVHGDVVGHPAMVAQCVARAWRFVGSRRGPA